MSFKAMGWASNIKTGSPVKKLILLILADRANNEGFCWPSMKTLVSDCELTREAISRNIKQLEASGYLHITKHKNKGKWKNNVYHLHVTQDHMTHKDHVTQDHTLCDLGSHTHVTQDHTNLSTEPINESIKGADAPDVVTSKAIEKAELFRKFLTSFNEITGRKFRILDQKAKSHINARLKEGFTVEEILSATRECMKDEYHKKNPKFLTPEFITRADKLQKYIPYDKSGKTPYRREGISL